MGKNVVRVLFMVATMTVQKPPINIAYVKGFPAKCVRAQVVKYGS